jgi:hypothetical protein
MTVREDKQFGHVGHAMQQEESLEQLQSQE